MPYCSSPPRFLSIEERILATQAIAKEAVDKANSAIGLPDYLQRNKTDKIEWNNYKEKISEATIPVVYRPLYERNSHDDDAPLEARRRRWSTTTTSTSTCSNTASSLPLFCKSYSVIYSKPVLWYLAFIFLQHNGSYLKYVLCGRSYFATVALR